MIVCVVFPNIVNLSEIIRMLFGGQSPDFSTAKYYFLMKSGNWTMGTIIAIVILFKYIRKSNENYIFCNGNAYHDYSYLWFFFCSKILGYKKCNLVLIPIYTEFKLVTRGTFKEFHIPENSFPEKSTEIEVIKIVNKKEVGYECNLILEDTYPVEMDQIPNEKRDIYTLKIKHKNKNDKARIFSSNFIETVCNTVRNLPDGIIVNVYATTNPKHNYEIAKQAFSLGNRGNVKKLNVYQQEKDGKRIFKKKKTIYRFFD